MVLGFKKQFVQPIKKGIKIHTIRHDVHSRWKAGRTIQMATGVRTKKYKCFRKDVCKSIQDIQIIHYDSIAEQWTEVFIDRRMLLNKEIIELSKNDGFKNTKDFFQWFNKDGKYKIIHWTDKKY